MWKEKILKVHGHNVLKRTSVCAQLSIVVNWLIFLLNLGSVRNCSNTNVSTIKLEQPLVYPVEEIGKVEGKVPGAMLKVPLSEGFQNIIDINKILQRFDVCLNFGKCSGVL